MQVVVALIVATAGAGVAVIGAGCTFAPSQSATGGAPDGTHDAAALDAPGHAFLDAPAKVFMDAPPCGDDDHDGVCNDVDDWPCGAKPAAPGNVVELTDNNGKTDFVLSNISINAGTTLAVATHGQSFRLQLDYNMHDTACADCVDQLEIGWHPTGHRAGCVFDTDVPSQGGRQGSINTTSFDVPAAPGVYELRVNIGQNFSCNAGGANDWWGGSEPPDIIAKLCVQ